MKKTYSLMLVGVMAFVPVTRAVDRIVTTTAAHRCGQLDRCHKRLGRWRHHQVRHSRRRAAFHPDAARRLPTHYQEQHHHRRLQPGGCLAQYRLDPFGEQRRPQDCSHFHQRQCPVHGNCLQQLLGFGDPEDLVMATANRRSLASSMPPTPWFKVYASNRLLLPIRSVQFGGDSKSICFAASPIGMCQNFRVSGCWFGIDPVTKQVAYMPDGTTVATPTIAIAQYDTAGLFNFPGTCGVAAGSANPRAEFNVFVTGLRVRL